MLQVSLRSAERRLELLHDVVSIRSGGSRRPRSNHSHHQPPATATLWRRAKEAARAIVAFVFSNVGICVLVIGYLVLGTSRNNLIKHSKTVTRTTDHSVAQETFLRPVANE